MRAAPVIGRVLCALLCAVAVARAEPPDEERAAWRFRREVRVGPEAGQGFVALPLPPDLLARAQGGLEDLRLVLGGGEGEVPYAVDRQEGYRGEHRVEGRLADTRWERERTVWVIDLEAVRVFDTIELEIPEVDFARRLQVEGSSTAPDGGYRVLRPDAGIFDADFGGRVHHTLVRLPQPTAARYLRLTATTREEWLRSRLRLRGAAVSRVDLSPQERWSLRLSPRALAAEPARRGAAKAPLSRYQLDLPVGLPIEQLEIAAEDPVFLRGVALYEEARGQRRRRAVGVVYRVRPTPVDPPEERLVVPVGPAEPGEVAAERLVLEVEDRDSPPLHGLSVRVSGVATRLLFPRLALTRAPLWLYYGNARTRGPAYDLNLLRLSARELGAAELLAEQENPRHRPAAPLAFVASLGARLELTRWARLRPLNVPDAEDIYGVVLPPEDLGVLRPDLGDLRIVDQEDAQVPYVLSRAELERAVPLQLTALPAERPGQSRYQLAAPEGLALPLSQLELTLRERFFTRRARLLRVAEPGEGAAQEPVLWSGALAREEEPLEGAEPEATVLRLSLSGERLRALRLEIDEGDNQPLHLQGARGVLLVPRLSFKARPGTYRVLLGNPQAEAPRYDIEALRRRVLDYAALPLQVGPLVQNPAFRPQLRDYVTGAPPTLLLWGAIGLVVLVLLGLTARLARVPASGAGGRPGSGSAPGSGPAT